MSVNYVKLRDGSWGIRLEQESPVVPGQAVVVHKRDSTTKKEVIAKVLWEGNGVALCTIVKQVSSAQMPSSDRGRLRGRRTGCACGSIEGEYHDWYCKTCKFDELDQ